MESGLENLTMRRVAGRLPSRPFVPMILYRRGRVIVGSGRGFARQMVVSRHSGMTRKRRLHPSVGQLAALSLAAGSLALALRKPGEEEPTATSLRPGGTR